MRHDMAGISTGSREKRIPQVEPQIDGRGFVRCAGIIIGKRVVIDGEYFLQIVDKDRRRSAEQGTRYRLISFESLVAFLRCDEVKVDEKEAKEEN